MELPTYHRAVLVHAVDETFCGGVSRPVVHRDKGGEEREDNLDEDTLLPCGGCSAVLSELVAAGTAPAAQRLDERYISVIEYAVQNGSINNTDVQNLLNVSKTTAYRILSQLNDWLEVQGTTGKGTHYIIKGFIKE